MTAPAPVFFATTAGFTFIDGHQDKVEIAASWSPADPLTVTFTFSNAGYNETWDIARALIRAALSTADLIGEGDVKVGGNPANRWFSILLMPGTPRAAHILVPRANLEWLIAQSVAECIPGGQDEADAIERAIDEALRQIFEGST